jgi:tetratricopeptide (TPR) repeat protein
LTLVLLATAPAFADDKRDAEAKALFQAGREAFDGGRYEAALARWQEAYDLSGRATLLYNLGLAADRLRQDDKALASFKAYLDKVPQAENRAEVEGRISALEKAKAEREAAATAPTPQQTARASSTAEQTRNDVALTDAQPHEEAAPGKPITKQWWFWTGVGGVVVVGVVAAIALSSGGTTQGKPFESRSGVTIMTLTGTR